MNFEQTYNGHRYVPYVPPPPGPPLRVWMRVDGVLQAHDIATRDIEMALDEGRKLVRNALVEVTR